MTQLQIDLLPEIPNDLDPADIGTWFEQARETFTTLGPEEQLYLESLRQFICRVYEAWENGQIDNASLYAGSPIHYYCKACGAKAAVMPECHTGRPPQHCGVCLDLGESRLADAIVLRRALGLTLPTTYTKKGRPWGSPPKEPACPSS